MTRSKDIDMLSQMLSNSNSTAGRSNIRKAKEYKIQRKNLKKRRDALLMFTSFIFLIDEEVRQEQHFVLSY